MEKELSKMKLLELFELKNIVLNVSEEYGKQITNYSTNGLIDKLYNLTEIEKEIVNKKIQNDNLLKKINELIEKKLKKYYYD